MSTKKETSTALVLDAKQYGIEPTRAQQIEKVFVPIQKLFSELDAEYKEILSQKKITPELCEKASTLRKKYVKVRTSADQAHDLAKEKVLIEGRAIDGIRNIIKFATSENEEKLREIEEHFERIERARLEALVGERTKKLQDVGVDPTWYKLNEMSDEIFDSLLESSTKAFNEKKEKEAEEEKQRQEQAQRAAIAQERKEKLLKVWDFLTDDQKYLDYGCMEAESFDAILGEATEKKMKKDAQDEKIRKENLRLKQEADKQAREAEEKLRVEREAKEKAEAELQAKADEEARIKAEQAAKERAARRAPDKKKLVDFAAAIRGMASPVLKSEEGQNILAASWELLNKTASYIETNAAKL